MKKTATFGAIALSVCASLFAFGLFSKKEESREVTPEASTISHKKYVNIRFNYSFEQKYPDVKMEHLTLPGKVGRFGVEGNIAKFVRGLRFKDICDAVEERYNLPSGIIFGMMIEESNGVDLLPNGLGDGGFGLCHMQSVNAKLFGLKIFKGCSTMVCNGKDQRSCKKNGKKLNHAKDLSDFINENGINRKALVGADDRLHPIKNLDAVGRMLACFMDGRLIKGLGPFRTAICRYAGKYNYEQYWRDVRKYITLLEDKSFLKKVEQTFDALNQNLLIDGEKGNWQSYLEAFRKMNDNYGLSEYKSLPKYEPKNSELVKRTYKNFL